MISYYKKVFLASLRFRFLGITSAMLGSGLLSTGLGIAGSAGKGFLGGLFGGGGSSNSNQAADIIKAQQEEEARKDNLAGNAEQKSTIPAPEPIQTKADRLGQQVGALGKDMAGDFIQQLSSKFIDSKVSSIFRPKTINPAVRGASDKAYTNARFPGVNPWELAGGGAASGGQGGAVPASINQRTQEETAETGARARQRSAHITSQAPLKSVEIQYQESPHKIRGMQAGAAGQESENVQKQALEKYANNFADYAKEIKYEDTIIKKAAGTKAMHEGAVAQERVNAETIRKINESLHSKEVLRAKTADRKVAEAWARVANILAGNDTRASATVALAGLASAIRLITPMGIFGGRFGRGGAFGRKSSIGLGGKITNWPKYGAKAGQVHH